MIVSSADLARLSCPSFPRGFYSFFFFLFIYDVRPKRMQRCSRVTCSCSLGHLLPHLGFDTKRAGVVEREKSTRHDRGFVCIGNGAHTHTQLRVRGCIFIGGRVLTNRPIRPVGVGSTLSVLCWNAFPIAVASKAASKMHVLSCVPQRGVVAWVEFYYHFYTRVNIVAQIYCV